MKKLRLPCIPLSAALLLTFFLLGCNKSTYAGDPFAVFSGDFTASLSVEINGNTSACLYEKNSEKTKITLTSPSVISGFVFSVSGDSVTLKSGNTEINADERVSFLPRLLSVAFSEQKENVAEIRTEKTEARTLTVIKTPNAVYYFNESGTPTAIEGVINKATFKITLNSFSNEKIGAQ